MSESGHGKVCQVLLAMQNKHNCEQWQSDIFANTEALQEEDDMQETSILSTVMLRS